MPLRRSSCAAVPGSPGGSSTEGIPESKRSCRSQAGLLRTDSRPSSKPITSKTSWWNLSWIQSSGRRNRNFPVTPRQGYGHRSDDGRSPARRATDAATSSLTGFCYSPEASRQVAANLLAQPHQERHGVVRREPVHLLHAANGSDPIADAETTTSQGMHNHIVLAHPLSPRLQRCSRSVL